MHMCCTGTYVLKMYGHQENGNQPEPLPWPVQRTQQLQPQPAVPGESFWPPLLPGGREGGREGGKMREGRTTHNLSLRIKIENT